MKKESFFVTRGIPGIAAKGEIIKMDDNGILVGRWLPISKCPQLMNSRDRLRVLSTSSYSPETRPPRRPGGFVSRCNHAPRSIWRP
jgi:hypothetical protein